ncbi:hypothetical protein DF220_06435 [Salinibacterium hongtaonis]|uniref:Uncharacterized protein n=1 Tax=Homoserinimonas hongtaonis TaxID=2079791 RepID=A0A2U1T0X2_9MICO|nr:hypothetical protein DF220_06435 [Salinibacterium hongtaonis]
MIGAAAAAGATLAARSARTAAAHQEEDDTRWRTVSIYRSREEILPGGGLPVPLAELGAAIEVRAVEAPGGRGTELSARWAPGSDRTQHRSDRVGALRRALRNAKQLIEAGEIATTEGQPEGSRSATPTGFITDLVSSKAKSKGVS